jgi:5,10-methenyltetrahydrofolate synthetase
MALSVEDLKLWRKSQRARLISARVTLAPDTVESVRKSIDASISRSFPGLARGCLAFCWPIKNEYDARHVTRTLRERGALTALPLVVAPKQPLAFREWYPGIALEKGPLDIPYPVGSRDVVPDAVLLPMNGWDPQGYRLGYGGGFFDRTLASLARKPVVIGVSYELARLDTIHPQAWDIPMDYVVTERGVYRRDGDALAFLGFAEMGSGSEAASPVCYADEDYFKGR